MKRIWILVIGILMLAFAISCHSFEPEYEYFTIKKGEHYATYRSQLLQSNSLSFYCKFDESAIYTTQTEENQWDTNKLMGFSDCNTFHHVNSARFGWRWVEERLEIIVYCYVDSQVIIEKIGDAQLNKEHFYQINLHEDKYEFIFDDEVMEIGRAGDCQTGTYYMLFPYFGGDEVAPHDITIGIKFLY